MASTPKPKSRDDTRDDTRKGRIAVRTCTGVFWRAGRSFTEQPREIALADLSVDDEAAIRAERQLIVTDIGDDTPGA